MLKQAQRNELSLTQKLSQRQILLMKLLQIPTVMLEQRINEELEQNPALEIVEETPNDHTDDNTLTAENQNEDVNDEHTDENDDTDDDYNSNDDVESYFMEIGDDNEDNNFEYNYYTHEQQLADEKKAAYMEASYVSDESYQEILLAQLGMFDLSEEDRKILTYIIGSIDDSGLLTRTTTEMANDLLFSMNIQTKPQHIEELLVNVVHKLDPAGSGAKDLRECLSLQLERLPETEDVIIAKHILNNDKCFLEFTKKHYTKLQQRLKCTDEELSKAINCIVNLDPRPGNILQKNNNSFIVPDFEVMIDEKTQEIQLTMPDMNLPKLQVSKLYTNMNAQLKENKTIDTAQRKEAMQFVRQKRQAAQWFIEALEQRESTLYRTMWEIIQHQKEFFLSGDKKQLKPMILKDIATCVGSDVSTISRVVKQKYVQTPYGIIPLKFFFSESIHKEDGEEVSSRKIKEIITEAINNENRNEPLTDGALCQKLNEAGYKLARRTVAKYRESLGFPVARLRK